MRKALYIIGGIVLALGVGAALLMAGPLRGKLPAAMQATGTPTIGPVSASPNLITVNTPTQVTVTVQITDSRVIPTGVNLLRLNVSGNPTVLGVMRDDGTNGDAVAGDKTFSLRVNFNEATAGQIQLQVSGAFRGVLRRVSSTHSVVGVWNRLLDPALQYSIAYPPELQPSAVNKKVLFLPNPRTLDGDDTADIEIRILPTPLPNELAYLRSILAPGYQEFDVNIAVGRATQFTGVVAANVFGWGTQKRVFLVLSHSGQTYLFTWNIDNPAMTVVSTKMISTIEVF
jgi:hypothetical protein